jgi:uncharacterized membrane protein YsdA (DUF1294 family)
MRLFFSIAWRWEAVMSAAAFLLFAWDKRSALRGRRRVRERTLLRLCLLGGAPGGLAAMHLCRHKTRKAPFPWAVPLLCLAQLALVLTAAAFS